MNVLQKDEPHYRHLKKIADLLDWAGDLPGAEFKEEAREATRWHEDSTIALMNLGCGPSSDSLDRADSG